MINKNAFLIDHQKIYAFENGLILSPDFFSINTPFYMDSEWKAILSFHISKRKRAKHKSSYYESLTDSERQLIQQVTNNWKESFNIAINMDCNYKARLAAKEIEKVKIFKNSSLIHCNMENSPILVELFSHMFLIPPECSFQCGDINASLQYFKTFLLKNLVPISNKFLIIIDPPWSDNKSVKRKRNYSTQINEDIFSIFPILYDIIKIIKHLQINQHYKHDIRIAFWSTEKHQNIVKEMLKTIHMQVIRKYLWHKITQDFQSAKVRGSKEYLFIASPEVCNCDMEGIIVSIPSSIHSHKPPISQNIVWEEENEINITTDSKINSTIKNPLFSDKLIPLNGLELYARYLRKGFHSIGNECIKLQLESMFVPFNQQIFNSNS